MYINTDKTTDKETRLQLHKQKNKHTEGTKGRNTKKVDFLNG